MRGAIAIFVKTPGLSPVKTRLAAQLGRDTAESFHLASAQAVTAVVQASTRNTAIQCYYAVAEHVALQQRRHWRDLPCLWQGEGGLGRRMAHVYEQLLNQHDFVILVGADSPQMTAAELSIAYSCLSDCQHHQMVFGPSFDGGFWLFGGNCKVPIERWTSVTYSTADTGAQFLNKIRHLGSIQTLIQLRDADEPEDLPHVLKSLNQLSEPLPAQHALMSLLTTIVQPVAETESGSSCAM
ncbi:MAG TPA: glycosyltransferase [Crenotrichaceae bacterium]|nr:glycosyltransferase [Crenotrichaceae bacterium]